MTLHRRAHSALARFVGGALFGLTCIAVLPTFACDEPMLSCRPAG